MHAVHPIRSNLFSFLSIVMITSVLGEVKIYFFNSSFRFALGSAAFFFLLLLYKEISYLLISLASGIFIAFFRIVLDVFRMPSFEFQESFLSHSPIIGYYLVFTLFLYFGRANEFRDHPFYLGILGTLADGFANTMELFIRTIATQENLLTYPNLEDVVIVAFLRSFFVVGLFYMVYTKQMQAVFNEERRRFEQIQLISSELYVEAFYLNKLAHQIEDVTAKSHELYRRLKENGADKPLAALALTVAQEIHEVKKDNQRILAGLSKIIKQEPIQVTMTFKEIVDIMIRANQKYADMLKKDIYFRTSLESNFPIHRIYPFVVILNNLLANSVEAIEQSGEISIEGDVKDDCLEVRIIDNGSGIRNGEEDVIFEPGYTTKFDQYGIPSTGIGLSHVRTMAQELKSTISIALGERTVFIVRFPIEELQRGEE